MPGRHDLLAADIGGTNCRLAHFVHQKDRQPGGLELQKVVWLASADLASTADLLAAWADHFQVMAGNAETLSVAIAGPVLDGEKARLTNGRLELELAALRHVCPSSFLLNDFTAQAYACLLPAGKLARTVIRAGDPPDDSRPGEKPGAGRAALGAGTGLGLASLVPVRTGNETLWQAIPSEAGHTPFPFCGKEENAFRDFVCQQKQIPFATCEDILSARGLALLHFFLTGASLSPAEVGRQAMQTESQTLALYARFYGRVARNWILTSLCRGGLAICGGIAAKNPLVASSGHFGAELLRKNDSCPAHLFRLLQETPISLATDENCGLWGAAVAGLCLDDKKGRPE